MEQMNPQPEPVDRQARVSRWVRLLLAHTHRHQKDLAAFAHMDDETVSKAMNNKRRWQLEDLDTLADFFNVTPETFLGDPDDAVRTGSSCPHLEALPTPEVLELPLGAPSDRPTLTLVSTR